MAFPRWVTLAHTYIGIKEIKGSSHESKILELWKAMKLGGIKNDEIPWCAGFVGGILEMSGIMSSRADSAKSYLNWGIGLEQPLFGSIAVLERGKTFGHVGFVVGYDDKNNLLLLGGNQDDAVNIRSFALDRVISYRWPFNEEIKEEYNKLTSIVSESKLSKSEV